MKKISAEEVNQIAKLARIELNEKEKAKFSRELSEIFTFVEKLNKVNSKNIPMTSQVTGLENVYRKDEATEITQPEQDKKKNREVMLKNAPGQKSGYIKTRAVLE